jgi:anaerobic ribonucleoside-triphosphate reductase activating protein
MNLLNIVKRRVLKGWAVMRYHNITKDDMLNGDGLRVVLWVAGCTHGCRECQNQSTWDPEGGIPFDEAAKEELFAALEKGYISGVTFSGGDPLHPCNKNEIENLAKEIKNRFPLKTIWLYTGDLWENIKDESIVKELDVLVDGEFQIEHKDTSLHWKGSSNQRVIDVKQSLQIGKVVLHNT